MRRREIMPYPRFTKIIINHFLSLNASIPKGPSSGLHIIKDDGISSTNKLTRPLLNTPKKSKGKGSQGKQQPATSKKKVSIYVDDNIIPEPDVALGLRKSISLTKAEEEEAARRVHATHERLVSESDEPFDKPTNRPTGRRRPSGISFRDTSSVSKKKSPDQSQKLKADEKIEWLSTNEEEKKQDDVDDDRSIDIEETDDDDDEKTEYEFVHGDEHVHDDVDEEMKDAKDVETRNDNEEITDQKRQILKRQKYKYQFTVGHTNLTRVTPATTLPPPPFVTNLTPVLQQQSTPIPTPLISTTAPTTTIVLDPLPTIVQRVSKLQKDVQELKQKHTEEIIQQSSQKDVFKIIKIKQEQTAKEKVPKFSATLYDQAAEAEYKQKEILFKMMRESKSYEKNPKHKALYDALVLSLIQDEDDLDRVILYLRKRDPSKKTSKGDTPPKSSKTGKSASAEESVKEATHKVTMGEEELVQENVNNADQPQADSEAQTDNAPK
ncbi:hypothetical protein Tco_0712700 [Tanacetum coccineum]